ncbi:hypothetical protein H0H93_004120 [Arthromyces matolae]|nr:hypothetical protein H0H93_004120 [Arthromyces matolae]
MTPSAINIERVPRTMQEEMRRRVVLDNREGHKETNQEEVDRYTDQVVLATSKFARAGGTYVHVVTIPSSEYVFVDPRIPASAPELNKATVRVSPMHKDDGVHGMYKPVYPDDRPRTDLWILPQLESKQMANRRVRTNTMPTNDEGKEIEMKSVEMKDVMNGSPEEIDNYLSTSSVLQGAGLMGRLVGQYPKETPSQIKARMRDSDPEKFLRFPISSDSDVFRHMVSETRAPTNIGGHETASTSNAPQAVTQPPETGQSPSHTAQGTDANVVGAGLKRPLGEELNADNRRKHRGAVMEH